MKKVLLVIAIALLLASLFATLDLVSQPLQYGITLKMYIMEFVKLDGFIAWVLTYYVVYPLSSITILNYLVKENGGKGNEY